MQKKLIAVAVAGLMSGAAFAQTSVTIGGKFDAGYQFVKTQNTDSAAGGSNGGKTTEAQTDGSASSSRVSVKAVEDLGSGMKAGVDYDLRFGNVHEGKSGTTTVGGLTTNDKKAMYISVPGVTFQWGVANLVSNDYKLAEKPYMVSPGDWEGVKFGVSQWHEESLTARNTSFWTAPLNLGSFGIIAKGSWSGGENRKSGSNADGNGATASVANSTKKSGDVYSFGTEWKVGDGIASGGIDGSMRRTSDLASENGMIFHHYYVNVKPMKGLKFAAGFNNYKGYVAGEAWQAKGTNFVVNYTIGKLGLGLGVSHLHDLSSGSTSIGRNSGKGIMIGALYNLSKSTSLYAGYNKNSWDNNINAVAGTKYIGHAVAYSGNVSGKVDTKTVRVGVVKSF